MKELEMEDTPEAWQSTQHTYELANYMIQLSPEDYGMTMPTNTGQNPTDLDELVLLKNKATIPAFESIILHCRTRHTMMMGYKLHVMTQASYPEDQANLPNGVYVVKTYTELHDGSRNVSVVLRNFMGKPVHLPAGRPVAWVVAANAIPDATPSPEFMRKLDELEPGQEPSQKMMIEDRQKWPAHIRSIIISYNSTRSLVTGYSPYYLMFGRRPRLPIDLLFPTGRMQTLTRTIDEYVASLYDRLMKSLVIAQDCAIKEAQRQKRLYDRKVGAVELRPGDNVLVRLDAFRGQRRKLKNRWRSDLHMVVTRVADGIPAYVVKNNRTGKRKVVHRARLLLWLADYGEPVRCNHVDTSDVPTGTAMD